MGATATLSNQALSAEPGGEAQCEVRVRNSGWVVDQFTVEVLGAAGPWSQVEPPAISLLPGDEGVAKIRIRPPRDSATTAGPVPFGVRVTSKEDPRGSVVEEGTIAVGRFLDTFAELVPRSSRGRRSARHELALDNRGNTRINAQLSAIDPDNRLSFAFSQPTIVAEPGGAAFATVTVRPRERFLRGPARTIPFQVSAQTEGAPPLRAEGSMLHEALLPAWLPKALLGLAALNLLMGIAWLTLLRPKIESAAREKAEEVAMDVGADAGAQAARQELTDAGITPGEGGGGAGDGGGGAPGGGGSSTGSSTGPAIDGRLVVGGVASYQVPAGKTLQLTDIVLQNPDGSSGTLRVQRSGAPLLVVALQNFRDLDYHFIAPPQFTSGQRFELVAVCADACRPGAYWAGFLVDNGGGGGTVNPA